MPTISIRRRCRTKRSAECARSSRLSMAKWFTTERSSLEPDNAEISVTDAARDAGCRGRAFLEHGMDAASRGEAEYRLHHGRRYGLCRPFLLRTSRIQNPQHRFACPSRRKVPAGLRQLRGLLGDTDRAHHRALSIPPAGGSRRAHSIPKQVRTSARASHVAAAAV